MSCCQRDFDDELLYVVADLSAYNDLPCSFKEIWHFRRFSFLSVGVRAPSDFVRGGGGGGRDLVARKIYAIPEYLQLYVNKNVEFPGLMKLL